MLFHHPWLTQPTVMQFLQVLISTSSLHCIFPLRHFSASTLPRCNFFCRPLLNTLTYLSLFLPYSPSLLLHFLSTLHLLCSRFSPFFFLLPLFSFHLCQHKQRPASMHAIPFGKSCERGRGLCVYLHFDCIVVYDALTNKQYWKPL